MKQLAVVALIACAALAQANEPAPPRFEAFDIDEAIEAVDEAAKQEESDATALNDCGAVVGFFSERSEGKGMLPALRRRAFIWSAKNGPTFLGDLPGGIQASEAWAINNASVVVGRSSSQVGYQGFTWTRAQGIAPLPNVPRSIRTGVPGIDSSPEAWAINNRGVVGGMSANLAMYQQFAALWDASGRVTELGDLPGGMVLSAVRGVNDANTAVGFGTGSEPGQRAVLWTSNGTLRELGFLPGVTKGPSQALGINQQGDVVGWTTGDRGQRVAFIWSESTGMVELKSTKGESTAYAVNSQRQVVGESGGSAVLWNAQGELFDLNSPKVTKRPLRQQEFRLLVARGINEKGQITGTGMKGSLGGRKAFLLTPEGMPQLECAN